MFPILSECFFVDDVERNVEGARNYGLIGHRFVSIEKLQSAFEDEGIEYNWVMEQENKV